MALARRIGSRVVKRRLTRRGAEIGAAVVHYANGAVLGAVYAVVAEFAPEVTLGMGAAAGAAFALLGDEVALPAIGLVRSPRHYPLTAHADMLGEHLVYGITTDLGRRLLQRLL